MAKSKQQPWAQMPLLVDSEGAAGDDYTPRASKQHVPSNRPLSRAQFILGLCVVVFSAAVSFLAGVFAERHGFLQTTTGYLQPPGHTQVTFRYNSTFSKPPTPDTEAAWASIFPKGRGFVQHKQISPDITGVAVFHELHCLNALRNAYYTALHRNDTSEPHARDTEHGGKHSDMHNDKHHVRHCFDYLRQSLMCHADTNLEPMDWKLRGTTGWDSTRTCRDYSAVVSWAETWRTHNETAIA